MPYHDKKRVNTITCQSNLQRTKNHNSLIVLWNEIEGSTESLTAKHLNFIDVINYKSESEREEKVKNCIYTYYQSSTSNLLEYIRNQHPCFQKEEISDIIKKCLFVKVLKNEIPDVIASYIYTCSSIRNSNNSLSEDYCLNWSNPSEQVSSISTICQKFNKFINDLKEQLHRRDNTNYYRCSIFFSLEGCDTESLLARNEFLNSKSRTFHWFKSFPLQVSKVNDSTAVLHIYWRHYEFILRRIEEYRCLQDSSTLFHHMLKFLLQHEERYFENAYVINLSRRPDRRVFWENENSTSSLSKLPFLRPKILEAVDPIEVMEDVIEYENYKEQIDKIVLQNRRFRNFFLNKLPGFKLNPERYTAICLSQGAYGILMSNIKIMTTALDKDYLYTCIFEDDARFHKQFKEEWYQISTNLPADWNILALGTKNYHTPFSTSNKFHFFNEFTTGAHAMIYRKDALEVLLPFLKDHPFAAFDELLKIAMLMWPSQLRGYVVDPALVITLCGEDSMSDIQTYSKHCTETYDFFHWDRSKYDFE